MEAPVPAGNALANACGPPFEPALPRYWYASTALISFPV